MTPVRLALLSALWPGMGQWQAGGRRKAIVHAALPAGTIGVVAVLALTQGATWLGAWLLQPPVALAALAWIGMLGAWHVRSIVDAWRSARPSTPGRARAADRLAVGLAAIAVLLLYAYAAWFPWAFYRFGEAISHPDPVVSAPGGPSSPAPTGGPTEAPTASPRASPRTGRLTVLFVGIDATPSREGQRPLTDTILVASFDPATQKIDMVSIPRDVALFPLYDRPDELFDDKINELAWWADAHPERYPDGGMATLERQVEFLLGIEVDTWASVEIPGLFRLIEIVGGVDVVNPRLIDDPAYQFSADRIGFRLEPGPQHLDATTALAYARSRHGAGNSDYVRARRQQQLLLALREKLDDPLVVARFPDVLDAAARTVATNLPVEAIPGMVELARQTEGASVKSVVLGPSRYARLIPPREIRGLSAIRLDLEEIAALSVRLWGADSRFWTEPG